MHSTGNILVGIAVAAVAAVLFLGLGNMLRGGNPNLSQKLMRWRVGLQLFAVAVIVIVLLTRMR